MDLHCHVTQFAMELSIVYALFPSPEKIKHQIYWFLHYLPTENTHKTGNKCTDYKLAKEYYRLARSFSCAIGLNEIKGFMYCTVNSLYYVCTDW